MPEMTVPEPELSDTEPMIETEAETTEEPVETDPTPVVTEPPPETNPPAETEPLVPPTLPDNLHTNITDPNAAFILMEIYEAISAST
ncbi:MAG: hypothetical protein IKI93_10635, partial [Clostridia bacterium]|nr:hypothetical protein [Clostridia bacterium]